MLFRSLDAIRLRLLDLLLISVLSGDWVCMVFRLLRPLRPSLPNLLIVALQLLLLLWLSRSALFMTVLVLCLAKSALFPTRRALNRLLPFLGPL